MKYKIAAAALAVSLSLAASAQAAQPASAKLPGTMIWSSYDVGSSGYVEASAVADAMIRQYGTRIRIMPSGTSVGRLLPLKTGRANYGWLANEVFFATEAIYDFATPDWGPQDLRVLVGRPGGFGLAVAADAGVKEISDMRGKRVPFIKANPSINVKVEAILAFGGLTWDDVQVVEVPSYGAALRAVVDGLADAAGTVPSAAAMYELESSRRGIYWPPMPADNKEAWVNLQKVAPFFAPATYDRGAGLSPEKPAQLMSYRYPMITVYANADEDEAYNLTKAVHETYGLYKDASAVMVDWKLEMAGTSPADAPFHPGAIRYLKEIGVWGAEDDQWNERRLARMEQVRKAWETARAEFKQQKLAADKWEQFWMAYRAKNL